MSQANPADVARCLLEAEGRMDIDGVLDYLTEDFVLEMPYAKSEDGNLLRYKGRKVFRALLARYMEKENGFFRTFTFDHISTANLADGRRAIAEYSSQAVVRETGYLYRNRYIAIYEIREGKVCLWREYFDPTVAGEAEAQPPAEVPV